MREDAKASTIASGISALVALCAVSFSSAAHAQSTTTFSSTQMWGTTSSGAAVPGAAESAVGHSVNGNIAGQVNAARRGFLMNSGTSITMTSIGSQSVVNTSIVGNHNSMDVSATQSSQSAGNVTTEGTFVTQNTRIRKNYGTTNTTQTTSQ